MENGCLNWYNFIVKKYSISSAWNFWKNTFCRTYKKDKNNDMGKIEKNNYNVKIIYDIRYRRIETFCSYCNTIDHYEENCKNKINSDDQIKTVTSENKRIYEIKKGKSYIKNLQNKIENQDKKFDYKESKDNVKDYAESFVNLFNTECFDTTEIKNENNSFKKAKRSDSDNQNKKDQTLINFEERKKEYFFDLCRTIDKKIVHKNLKIKKFLNIPVFAGDTVNKETNQRGKFGYDL